MLPSLLTTDLCSLRGGVERLAFSVVWVLDDAANILDVPRGGGGGGEGGGIRIGQVEGVDGWGLGWGGGVDWGREWGAVCDLRRDRLSRRAGVRKVSVWAWESGERAPKLASAWMLFRHSIAQRLDHTRSCAAAPTFAPANAQHLLPSSLTRAHAHDRSSSTGR